MPGVRHKRCNTAAHNGPPTAGMQSNDAKRRLQVLSGVAWRTSAAALSRALRRRDQELPIRSNRAP